MFTVGIFGFLVFGQPKIRNLIDEGEELNSSLEVAALLLEMGIIAHMVTVPMLMMFKLNATEANFSDSQERNRAEKEKLMDKIS